MTEASTVNSPSSITLRYLTEIQIESIASQKTPQGIIALVKIPEDVYVSELPMNPGNKILFLEGVQDPGNVGTLIRTAAAFGYDGVLLDEHSADPFSPKVVQSTVGALFSVWVRKCPEAISLIKNLLNVKYELVAADIRGELLKPELSIPKHVLAIGSEGAGLSSQVLAITSLHVRIPFDNTKVESLNAAVAGSILMYVLSSK